MFTTLFFLAAAFASVAPQRFMTLREKEEMLHAHNAYRMKEVMEFNASNMRMMEWNDDLEKFAHKSVARCQRTYSGPERHKVGGEETTGENIMWSSARKITNLSIAVKMWYDEIAYYNYDTTECRRVCGHYTQVVWANSFKLGCAVTSEGQCKIGSQIYCNYAPAGNFIGGKPYKKGEPCQDCKGEWKKYCVLQLCSRTKVLKTISGDRADRPTVNRATRRLGKLLSVLICTFIAYIIV